MKTISLTRGQSAIVDDDDFDWLNQWKWCALKTRSGRWYATRKLPGKPNRFLMMHRAIVITDDKVDHVNGDGRDNRRGNLRVATNSQNLCNRGAPIHNKSGYKGVHFDRSKSRWMASICVAGKSRFLGYQPSKTSAAIAYNIAAIQMHGEFARPNDVFSGEVL